MKIYLEYNNPKDELIYNDNIESNQKLDIEIKKIYDDSKGRYASLKITNALNTKCIKVSQKRVARRMKILSLRSIVVKKYFLP